MISCTRKRRRIHGGSACSHIFGLGSDSVRPDQWGHGHRGQEEGRTPAQRDETTTKKDLYSASELPICVSSVSSRIYSIEHASSAARCGGYAYWYGYWSGRTSSGCFVFFYVSSSFFSITLFLRLPSVGRTAGSSGVPALMRGSTNSAEHYDGKVAFGLMSDGNSLETKKILRGSVRQVSPLEPEGFNFGFFCGDRCFQGGNSSPARSPKQRKEVGSSPLCFKTSHGLREVLVRSSAITVSCSYCHSRSAALPLQQGFHSGIFAPVHAGIHYSFRHAAAPGLSYFVMESRSLWPCLFRFWTDNASRPQCPKQIVTLEMLQAHVRQSQR